MPVPRSKYSNDRRQSRQLSVISMDKPLPQEPDFVTPAVQASLSRAGHRHHVAQVTPLAHSRSLSLPSDRILAPSRQHLRASVSVMEPRGPQNHMGAQTEDLATFLRHSGPLKSNPPPNMPSDRHVSPGASNDSAYSSGSDPQAEARRRKRQNTPARFGLFPDSKPTTPVSTSTHDGIRGTAQSPALSQSATQMQQTPFQSKRSSFSIRKMFHRRSKSNLLVM